MTESRDTDMHGLNRKIEQAKQELEHMIDLNPQVMLLVDRRGKVIRSNKALLEFLQFPDFQEVLNKQIDDIFRCEDPSFFSRLLSDQTGYEDGEAATKLPDNRSRLLKFTVVGAGEKTDLFAVIVEDETSEKERAARLEKEHKKEAVQAVAGALMHNLNQPLTVIMIRAQLMQLVMEKGPVNSDELKKSLHDIMSLTMQIADQLRAVKEPKDFVTEPYMDDVEILDISRSCEARGPESSFEAMINALMSALDTRVPGHILHSRRTGQGAFLLAKHMGLDKEKTDNVKHCAVLHDIGKIGIPDGIIQKQASLTGSEMEVMKKHTAIGCDLLQNIPSLKDEAEAAYTHHERYDGTGYPRGMAGRDIPSIARILAVADAFDALRFNRSYKPALPLETVVREIKTGAGAQFDPEVVKAFEGCYLELDRLASEA